MAQELQHSRQAINFCWVYERMEGKCSMLELFLLQLPQMPILLLLACFLFAHTFILKIFMESLLCAKNLVVHKTDKVPGVPALQAEGTGSAKVLGEEWAWFL